MERIINAGGFVDFGRVNGKKKKKKKSVFIMIVKLTFIKKKKKVTWRFLAQ